MIALAMGLLSYIPGFLSLATAITSKIADMKVQMYMARTGATKDVAIAAINAEVTNNQSKVNWLLALAKNPVMLFVVVGFALPYILFEWQCIVYDTLWMHGTTYTAPIKGQLADWGNIILTGIFVTSTGGVIAHAFVAKD